MRSDRAFKHRVALTLLARQKKICEDYISVLLKKLKKMINPVDAMGNEMGG